MRAQGLSLTELLEAQDTMASATFGLEQTAKIAPEASRSLRWRLAGASSIESTVRIPRSEAFDLRSCPSHGACDSHDTSSRRSHSVSALAYVLPTTPADGVVALVAPPRGLIYLLRAVLLALAGIAIGVLFGSSAGTAMADAPLPTEPTVAARQLVDERLPLAMPRKGKASKPTVLPTVVPTVQRSRRAPAAIELDAGGVLDPSVAARAALGEAQLNRPF